MLSHDAVQSRTSLEQRVRALLIRLEGHCLAAPSRTQSGSKEDMPQQMHSWTVDSEIPKDFRGESPLMWQQGGYDDWESYAAALRAAHMLVQERDQAGLLRAMGPEDGAFGAQCTHSKHGKLLSRDLLDSANELSFLEEHLHLSHWPCGTTMVDLGSGYGRFAHRVSQTFRHLQVICTDGVAHSLAVSERYLRFRAVPSECARVVPADEIEHELARAHPRQSDGSVCDVGGTD